MKNHNLFTGVTRSVYIVYIGEHIGEKTYQEIEDAHYSYLLSVKSSKQEAKASLVYSYKKVINCFSAWLTPDQAAKLAETEEVVSIFKSEPRRYSLQTTRSWDFVNLLEQQGQHGFTNTNNQQLLRKSQLWKRCHCWSLGYW
ncbi:hypothetical protein ACSBR1_015708 [Camellia fascicularis]